MRKRFKRKNFQPDLYTRHFDPHEQVALREVQAAQASNVVIYGAFSPFVGSGFSIGSWSIPVDLTNGGEDMVGYLQPKPFAISELYDEIARTLRAIGLPNCTIEDKLCISGLDIRGEGQFLPDLMARPLTQLSHASLEAHIAEPSMQSRHYQSFRLVDWSGELVVSTFLRVARTGQNLFVEVSYWLLPPVDDGYRRVDNMNPVPSWRDWMALIVCSAVGSVFIWMAWPFYIFKLVLDPLFAWLKEREVRKMIAENPAFNHGATTSLREATCASNRYRHYFQKIDKEMYLKTLESKILSCLVQFLDEHDVDTSDLKQAQTKIINSGIIVTGWISGSKCPRRGPRLLCHGGKQ